MQPRQQAVLGLDQYPAEVVGGDIAIALRCVAGQRLELSGGFGACVAAPDECKGEESLALFGILGSVGCVELVQDTIAEPYGIGESLEANRVLHEAGMGNTEGIDPGDRIATLKSILCSSPLTSMADAVLSLMSRSVTVPISRSVRSRSSRRGMTAWRGSMVPDAASGSSGEKRRKFSGAMRSTRSGPGSSSRSNSRAANAPPKPPPTMRTSYDMF